VSNHEKLAIQLASPDTFDPQTADGRDRCRWNGRGFYHQNGFAMTRRLVLKTGDLNSKRIMTA